MKKKTPSIPEEIVIGSPNPGRFGRVLATFFLTGLLVFLLLFLRSINLI